MIYRLMKTMGTQFLNENVINTKISSFVTVSDFIAVRSKVLKKDQNNSTFVTIDESGNTVIYGKVYGASKKETTLITLAMNEISTGETILYEFIEGNLKRLPKKDSKIIKKKGIKMVDVDRELEKKEFEENNSLRSPKYLRNLLNHLGPKKCAFCGCTIPQIIQGAHIFSVSAIKEIRDANVNKQDLATDGNNGIWLCNNHHKLFDSGFIKVDNKGNIIVEMDKLSDKEAADFIMNSLGERELPKSTLTRSFIYYLRCRNEDRLVIKG